MTMDEKIKALLTQAFDPVNLTITNESHLHAGHSGDDGSGETHYHIAITSSLLNDMNRIERQRAVMKTLKPCYEHGLHALTIIPNRA